MQVSSTKATHRDCQMKKALPVTILAAATLYSATVMCNSSVMISGRTSSQRCRRAPQEKRCERQALSPGLCMQRNQAYSLLAVSVAMSAIVVIEGGCRHSSGIQRVIVRGSVTLGGK